jgi:hypothetical protein
MKVNKAEFRAAAADAVARAQTAGRQAAQRIVEATDTALVEVGKAAKQRQRYRATRAAVKTVGKLAIVAGVVVVAAMVARAAKMPLPGRA